MKKTRAKYWVILNENGECVLVFKTREQARQFKAMWIIHGFAHRYKIIPVSIVPAGRIKGE